MNLPELIDKRKMIGVIVGKAFVMWQNDFIDLKRRFLKDFEDRPWAAMEYHDNLYLSAARVAIAAEYAQDVAKLALDETHQSPEGLLKSTVWNKLTDNLYSLVISANGGTSSTSESTNYLRRTRAQVALDILDKMREAR